MIIGKGVHQGCAAVLVSLLLSSVANAGDDPVDDWTAVSEIPKSPIERRLHISADGSCVAYQRYRTSTADPVRVFVLDRQSGKTRQLPFDSASKVALVGVSSDCRQVVLQDVDGEDGQVYYLNATNPIGLPERTTILPGAKYTDPGLLSGDGNAVVYRDPSRDGLLFQRLAPGLDTPVRLVQHVNVRPNPAFVSEHGDMLAFTTTAKVYGGAPPVPGSTGHNGGPNTVLVSLRDGKAEEFPVSRAKVGAQPCDQILPIGFAAGLTAAVRVAPQRCHTCEPPKGKYCKGSAGMPFPSASLIDPMLASPKRLFTIEGQTSNDPAEEYPWFLAVVPETEKLVVAFRSRQGSCLRVVENATAHPACIATLPAGDIPQSAVISKDGRWMAFVVAQQVTVVPLGSP